MKKQKNQSRLKDQENSPERTNNETYHSNIIDSEFKKEIIKILKGLRKAVNRNAGYWASLVAQWLRICLPMQGTRVRTLVWEDPTCHGAAGPVSHNY